MKPLRFHFDPRVYNRSKENVEKCISCDVRETVWDKGTPNIFHPDGIVWSIKLGVKGKIKR